MFVYKPPKTHPKLALTQTAMCGLYLSVSHMANKAKSVNSFPTCYQLHTSILSEEVLANVIDYTEKKLVRKIEETRDAQKKLLLVAMLKDYTEGQIAVSWKRGVPHYTKITQDKK